MLRVACPNRALNLATQQAKMLSLRFESELTAQKLEICRLWGLSKQFGLSAITPPVSAPDVKSLMSSPVSWCAQSL
jgi:hypothetical protein